MARRRRNPEVCPVCAEPVPPAAAACPGCGADHESGWREEARYDGLDLPDPEFNYEEFVEKEWGGRGARPRGLSPFWWIVGLLVTLLFVLLAFRLL